MKTDYAAPIIYYIEQDTDPWLGPNVVKRWGPQLTQDGEISDGSDTTPDSEQPDKWKYQTLVDMVADNPSSIGGCSFGSTPTGAADQTDGFFVCLDMSASEPREIEVHLNGTQEAEFDDRGIDESKADYGVVTKTFTRISSP